MACEIGEKSIVITYGILDIAEYIPTIDLVSNHPEYVMGWTTCSLDTGSSFSLTTTLNFIFYKY